MSFYDDDQNPFHQYCLDDLIPKVEKLKPIPSEVADKNRKYTPSLFQSKPITNPADQFLLKTASDSNVRTFNYPSTRYRFASSMLIYIAGQATSNHAASVFSAAAGYGIIFGNSPTSHLASRLELDNGSQTAQRAILRAATVALKLRRWDKEGWKKLVVATDSDYLVDMMCEHVMKWEANGWKASKKKEIKNVDLILRLKECLRELEKKGVLVQFWKIEGKVNLARKLAEKGLCMEDEGGIGQYGEILMAS